MANIKDFAAGIVVTPPSPATSGTSLTLRAGDGASMPTPPFYVTATPPGQLTTLGTSEKLLVTAVSTDTLTVVRAQSPTTAKSIDANWIVANAMYVDDVMKSNIATDEALTGTKNGTNQVFTTASSFTAIQVYKNGVAMHIGDDFTVTGSNQITMVTAPVSGTQLTATYIIGSQIMISGSNSTKSDETPTGTVNGSNTSFTTLTPYIANTLQVYVNGVKQKRGTHFSEVTPTSGTFTMSDAPLTGDDIMVEYQFVQSVAGNADTVDGYHANVTPTASQIPVLDSNAKLPLAANTSGIMRQLGFGARDNVDKSLGTVTAGTWYAIRNTADSADLAVTFTNTQSTFYAEVAITTWGGADSYRNVRLIIDGSTGTITPSFAPASFLLNGVAPGLIVFQITATPGSHTINVNLSSVASTTMNYRVCTVKIYEVLP